MERQYRTASWVLSPGRLNGRSAFAKPNWDEAIPPRLRTQHDLITVFQKYSLLSGQEAGRHTTALGRLQQTAAAVSVRTGDRARTEKVPRHQIAAITRVVSKYLRDRPIHVDSIGTCQAMRRNIRVSHRLCPNEYLNLTASLVDEDAELAKDRRFIEDILLQTRKDGYASSVGGPEAGISAIALAVPGGGPVLCSLSLIFFSSSMTPEAAAEKYLPRMKNTVKEIERQWAAANRARGKVT